MAVSARLGSVLFCSLSVGSFALHGGSLPGPSHSIRMHPDQRGVEPEGMLVRARINSAGNCRLLVDTGATRILLSKAAASRAGVVPSGALRIFGVGSEKLPASYRGIAQSVSVDGVELRGVEVDVADVSFPAGVDGLLGPSVFGRYLVRFDGPRRRLELVPDVSVREPRTPAPGRLLLVSGEIKGSGGGLFLVDTGAGHSVLDQPLAASEPAGARIAGVAGAARAQSIGPVEFTIAGRKLIDRNAYAADLSELRRRTGLPISGLIGFPALRHSVLTIDYHSGEVRIERR